MLIIGGKDTKNLRYHQIIIVKKKSEVIILGLHKPCDITFFFQTASTFK